MAIGVIWDPPVDQQAYDAVKERVFRAAQDAGMRFHAAGNSPEGWRIIEVWDSREGLEGFIDQHCVRRSTRSVAGKCRRRSPRRFSTSTPR